MAEFLRTSFKYSAVEGYRAVSKDDKKKAAKAEAAKPKPVALPDEEQIKRTARRNAALRFGALGSGRASTILSNDKLGA